MSKSLVASNVNSQPNESDHKVVYSEFEISKIPYGPGIIRANSTLFNDRLIKSTILQQLAEETSKIPLSWNPHTRLDFVKYKLREIMLREGKKLAVQNKSKLEYANEEINSLEKELDKILSKPSNGIEIIQRIDSIKESIDIAKSDIETLKNEEAERLIFRSRAKWAEKGEKSNKYFLNLLKERQKAMIVRKIVSNGIIHHKQDEISKAIVKFYRDLYKKQTDIIPPDNSRLFKDLPKISTEHREMLDKQITLCELWDTLRTCDESAPGPDGITYRTIEHSWEILGPLILDSWKYSQSVGTTSMTQRCAVITLLEKKDKDKSKIENLRPISLSNCDIKLCTKALALRTNKVLPSILSVTQTGYIPGRQVNDNSRLLEEIINEYKNTSKVAYLITLDAKKAFDSVDHTYLSHILGLFGFPIGYINNIKTIYHNLSASILVNGFTSDYIDIEQSVKQGDALSCALFIIAIEPLLRQLNKNTNIKGIELVSNSGPEKFTVKDMSFADDITALCTNLEGIQEIINEYVNFSKYSGIKLNIEKTEIMVIGKQSNDPIVFNIRHNETIIKITDASKVKICGITFSNNTEEAYKENITSKIAKLERQLNIWRQRNLTLQGKILIIKTFGISQLIYSLQATIIKTADLKLVDDIIFRFIWNTKSTSTRCIGKINRTTLKSTVERGGLNAPDIVMIDRAIKLKNIIRCTISNHPVSILIKNEINRTNFQLCKFVKCKSTTSAYFRNVLETNKRLELSLATDIQTMSQEVTGINSFYHQTIQNHRLINSELFNNQMQNMLKRLSSKGIDTVIQLHKEKENPTIANIRLDCLLVYSKVPKSWKALLTKSKKSHPDTSLSFSHDINKSKLLHLVTQKDIYLRLTQQYGIADVVNYLNNKHNIQLTSASNAFTNVKRITSIKSLQNVQYKILHNVYPTMAHLFKWKIKDSDLCSCCRVTESLQHAIWDCKLAKITISNLETIINNTLDLNISLSFETILLGLTTCDINFELNSLDKHFIDEVIIIIKRNIILQRENKRILSMDELKLEIRNLIRTRKIMKKKLSSFEGLFMLNN